MNTSNIKKILSYIFNKIPFLGRSIRYILGKLADILFFMSKNIGDLYTILFGFLGTSWYDHKYDYLRGVRNYHWLERVFFALPKISEGDMILDIGCGDGIYSGEFYSEKAKRVLAIDINQSAITNAKKYYGKKNVKFLKKNVITWNLPIKTYNVVIMFAVIEHFTQQDGLKVLGKIRRSLKKDGVFFGSTPIFKTLDIANWEHKNEFTSEAQLVSFLKKIFNKVLITRSVWTEERSECYFECRM